MPPDTLSAVRFDRLLLTGAAGGLGKVLRPRLKAYCTTLRISDVAPLDAAGPGEEVMPVPLQDGAAMLELLRGVNAVVHMGGVSTEGPFEPILQANIVGVHNLYEAARKQGVKRILFASSNHATGFYRQDEVIDARMPMRPDGNYGVSKAFGENLSRFYYDRYGIETACLRIGASFPEPKDRRMLSIWLSYDDLERLIVACLAVPVLGHTVVYGVSDNATRWWDNTPAAHLGFRPQDSSEQFRAARETRQPIPPGANDPATMYQGGSFVTMGPFD